MIIDYDTRRYDFARMVREMLGVPMLDRLALQKPALPGASIYKNMEMQPLYARFREAMLAPGPGEELRALYRGFVGEYIAPLFEEPIAYQALPTPRLQFIGLGGEERFHRDVDYGHHPQERNILLPLTPFRDAATVWIEAQEDSGDYRALELVPGQCYLFDAGKLRHGTRENTSDRSRASFDFRVIPTRFASGNAADPPTRLDPHAFVPL